MRIAAAMLAVLMTISLFGCAGSGGDAGAVGSGGTDSDPSTESIPSRYVDVLKIGTRKPADTFNMTLEDGSFGKMNYNAFCAGLLLQRDENGDIVPCIMTEWNIADDGLSMEAKFAVDKGVAWHDGVPLTIDDIIFTFNFLKDVKKSNYVRTLQSVEKLDDVTLRLVYETPAIYASMNSLASFGMVYPKHVFENVENYREYTGADASIGCGPYKLVDIDEDAQTLYYEAVADSYLGKELTVKKVQLRSYDTQESVVMALKLGEIDAFYDYSNSLDASLSPSLENVEGLDPGMSMNTGNYQLHFGFNKTPTNDIKFRKAVRSALSYQLLATAIGGKDGEIGSAGVVPPSNLGADLSLPRLSQDVENAKATLDAAGYADVDGDGYRELPTGEPMDILVTPLHNASRQTLYLRICEIIMSDLDAIGVKSTLDDMSVSNNDYATEFRKSGQYDLFVGYTSPGFAMFESCFFYMYPDKKNPWGTCTIPEFNAEYERLMISQDEDEYVETLKELQRINAEQVVGVPLCWDKAYFPYRTDQYSGWENQPGWGPVNSRIWYNLVNIG
jgi:peptide/nickel transport system substrate-binding protein